MSPLTTCVLALTLLSPGSVGAAQTPSASGSEAARTATSGSAAILGVAATDLGLSSLALDRAAVAALLGRSRPAPTSGFDWPLSPTPAVARAFEAPPQPWAAGHRGVDLRATAGAQVRSAGEGTVTWSGVIAGRGMVTVTHPDGRRTTYQPLDARAEIGTSLSRGDLIGVLTAAGSHCAPAACLHWGLLVGPEDYRDPLTLLRPPRVVLLPVPRDG